MDGYQRRTERKKEDIRHAARALFSKHGFSRVSMGDIAREAQVSHVTVYNYFGNKENLVRDIIKTVMAEIVAQSEAITKSDKPFLEKLDGIIFTKVQAAGQYRGELTSIVQGNRELQEFLDSLWTKEVTRVLGYLLKEGQQAGYISRAISLEAVELFYDIVRAGLYALNDNVNRATANVKLLEELNHLFIYGLVDKIPSPD